MTHFFPVCICVEIFTWFVLVAYLVFIVFRLGISLLIAYFVFLSYNLILNTVNVFSILLFCLCQWNIISFLTIFFEINLILIVFIGNIYIPIKSIRTLILRVNVLALNFLFARHDSWLRNLVYYLLSSLPCLYQISMFFWWAQALLLVFWAAICIFH